MTAQERLIAELTVAHASPTPRRISAADSRRAKVIGKVASRLTELEEVRQHCEAAFEVTGDIRFAIRRTTAVEHVAKAMKRQVDKRLHQTVRLLATKWLGWRAVKHRNKRLYVGVRRKGLTDEQALEEARLARGPRHRQWWELLP